MTTPTATAIATAILVKDPQLVEFRKNPKTVLSTIVGINITQSQAKSIQNYIDSYKSTIESFYPQAGQVVGKPNWKKAAKYVALAIAALLE